MDLKFSLYNHRDLPDELRTDLYRKRKITFKDRLNWEVSCIGDCEYDKYDDKNTLYLIGTYADAVICGVRFIDTSFPHMQSDTFNRFFSESIHYQTEPLLESSRFFIDKKAALSLRHLPVCQLLFLAMIDTAMFHSYQHILTLTSKGMLLILRKCGWEPQIIATGQANLNETVYLLKLKSDPLIKKMIQRKIRNNFLFVENEQ
ncbi:acyl-homoserine-lactone synthase [Pantoea endophytica]